MQDTYPGLEKEQENPNSGPGPAHLCWPSLLPVGSPLEGCQPKRGISPGMLGPKSTSGAPQHAAHDLCGPHSAAPSLPAPPSSPSAWGDAGAAAPTISALHPTDSAPTVDGPAPKRARLLNGRAGAQLSVGWVLTAASGAADSDSDGEEAVLSRRHPTPGKAPAAAGAPTARVLAQHPPPTWAASPRPEHQAAAAVLPPQRTADAEAQHSGWHSSSDMDTDDCRSWADWQRFPLPLFNDVEE